MAGNIDQWRIDEHKLIFHPRRVADWLEGKEVWPICMEVGPASTCSHRCYFCAFDYVGYPKVFINTDNLLSALTEAAEKGLKAVMFAGEGEPLLHPDIAKIVARAKNVGLDAAITSNASLLTSELAREILPHLTWFRASINAGTPETYARVHRVSENEFSKVLHNLERAVEFKNNCTIGAQIVVLPENRNEVDILATRLASIGLDYLIVKPYSQHPKSIVRMPTELLPEVHAEGIKIIMRYQAEGSLRAEKTYEHCLGLPFWTYIDAQGNVWGCSCFLGDERFLYGNINQETFSQIWEGDRRRKSLEWVENDMPIEECRKACRLDQINQYLWELKKAPPLHVNFI